MPRMISPVAIAVAAALAATSLACGPGHARYAYADTALVPARVLAVAEAGAAEAAAALNQSRSEERDQAFAADTAERNQTRRELDDIEQHLLQPDLPSHERQALLRRQLALVQALRAPVAADYEHVAIIRDRDALYIRSEHRTVDGSSPTRGVRHIARVHMTATGVGSRMEIALARPEDGSLVLDSLLGIDTQAGLGCTPGARPSPTANPRTCDIEAGGALAVERLTMVDRVRIPGRIGRAVVELGSELGMGMDPAIDGAALGYRLTGRVGLEWGARRGRGHEWQLWSLAGAGPGLRGATADCAGPCGRSVVGFEPELLLRLSRVPVAELVPGRRIATGRGLDLDLRLSGMFDELDRSGLSAALAVRYPGWGGVFVRAGHLWGQDGGATFMAGVDLDSVVTLGGVLGAALIAAAIQGIGQGIGHGIRDAAVGDY